MAGAGVLLGALMTVAFAFPAFAEVRSLRLTFTNQYEVGEVLEPSISVGSSGVSLDSVEWSRELEKWVPGSAVVATLTLSSDEGFASSYGSGSCKVTGATLQSARGDGDTLTVKVRYQPVVELDAPEEAGWSPLALTRASWDKVSYATGYQLRLYRDDSYIRTIDVTGTNTDLAEYMTKEGYYYYEIRAVGKDSNDRKYRKSSEYTMSETKLLDNLGDTGGSWRRYNESKKYLKEDGNYAVNEWYRIVGTWYYFDDQGFAVTGWKQINGVWYYLNSDGVMQTGWQQIDGRWYYLNSDGSMAVGWTMTEPGKWYYMNPDGSMAANTTVDGKTLDASGLCID